MAVVNQQEQSPPELQTENSKGGRKQPAVKGWAAVKNRLARRGKKGEQLNQQQQGQQTLQQINSNSEPNALTNQTTLQTERSGNAVIGPNGPIAAGDGGVLPTQTSYVTNYDYPYRKTEVPDPFYGNSSPPRRDDDYDEDLVSPDKYEYNKRLAAMQQNTNNDASQLRTAASFFAQNPIAGSPQQQQRLQEAPRGGRMGYGESNYPGGSEAVVSESGGRYDYDEGGESGSGGFQPSGVVEAAEESASVKYSSNYGMTQQGDDDGESHSYISQAAVSSTPASSFNPTYKGSVEL